jgi:hypothetical protein
LSFSFVFLLNFGCPVFFFNRAGVGAGNEVEGDPGNDVPSEDPISSASRNPANNGSRANPASAASGDRAAATAPIGTLPGSFLNLPRRGCFLLDLYPCLLAEKTSTELAPGLQEIVLVKSSSEDNDEDSPARRAASFVSGASPQSPQPRGLELVHASSSGGSPRGT